ncbi:MAG TPA: hypothetical protein VGD71_40950 [Kribbella sp.]
MALVMAGVPGGGSPGGGLLSSLRRRKGGMMGFAVLAGGGNQRLDHATGGVLTCTTRADRFKARSAAHAAGLAEWFA